MNDDSSVPTMASHRVAFHLPYWTNMCTATLIITAQVTHNGLDAMVRRMVSEMNLLAMDADEDVAYNSTRYDTDRLDVVHQIQPQ